MMKKQNIFLGVILVLMLSSLGILSAQTIDTYFPRHPYRPVSVILNNGVKGDTIYDGELDDKGKVHISIPESYKGYRGLITLTVGYRPFVNFIVAGEDISIKCDGDESLMENTEFINSEENTLFYRWAYEQQKRIEKIVSLENTLRVHSKEDSFYESLSSELQRLKDEQQEFEQMLSQSNLYAARLIQLRTLYNNELPHLAYADIKHQTYIRNYVRDSLDINSLYTSALWFGVLNSLVPIYEKEASFHSSFIEDMSILLSKTKSDRIYLELADNLFSICQAMGWNNHEEELASYLINGRHITEPTGKIKLLFSLFKLSKGVKAPQLSQGILPKKKTILAFYDSGCGNCTSQMNKLTELYPELQTLGYEVISLSSDVDKALFEHYAEKLPWKTKYCDLKGFVGKDFSNYGIMGTPTFYLLDEKGIVQGRYARIEDIKIHDK
ncbi:redoxin domain-containing protein [Dysgonomonas sp. Marseille-P4677]|uniref:peroxiredoxin family protein n=1 Tax=Dysgonomonas sp. Marseille-P4677 TaxID=2364790 RepID=UPI0019118AD0|nr:thioredoxin-like domain-containing protein [Dysgonomonas sp. Marseille-P4677]MBK5722283.1 redoxin domain-containing protein [Dysgonomonas sp. Marseille-P4677]